MKRKTYLVLVFFAVAALAVTCKPSKKKERLGESEALKPYPVREFNNLKNMKGFSEALLKTHLALYRGYVRNTNELLSKLRSYVASGRTNTPEYAETKRRLAFEFDGMKLHEAYFQNLGGTGSLPKDNPLYQAIVENFGSFENWRSDFTATGSMRGIGWVILYKDVSTGRLMNAWINEHETGHLVGCVPLVVMDMFEHAYIIDYGLDRAAYIKAFLDNLDWKTVARRFGCRFPVEKKTSSTAKKEETGKEKPEKTRHHEGEAVPSPKAESQGHEPGHHS